METRKITADGITFNIRCNKVGDVDVIREVVEGDCYKLRSLSRDIAPPRVILDVGGHIGTFSVLAAHYWPSALIIAVEPNKGSFELYKMNMDENGFNNYKIYNNAINYNSGYTYLTDCDNATGGGFLTNMLGADAFKKKVGSSTRVIDENVCLTTVEDIVREHKIASIDLAKWDCEGGEISAFNNMQKETIQLFQTMVGEYHVRGGIKEFLRIAKAAFPNHTFIAENNGSSIGPFSARKLNKEIP